MQGLYRGYTGTIGYILGINKMENKMDTTGTIGIISEFYRDSRVSIGLYGEQWKRQWKLISRGYITPSSSSLLAPS